MADWKYRGPPPRTQPRPIVKQQAWWPPNTGGLSWNSALNWKNVFNWKSPNSLAATKVALPPGRWDTEGWRNPINPEERAMHNYVQNRQYVPPPPGRPFEQEIPDIEKGMVPVMRKWKPDYTPTYWENPVHLARAYMQYKAAKPGDVIPDWYDPEAFEQAYKYYNARNNGAPWYDWKYLHPDDPGRQYLQSLNQPAMEYALPKNDYQRWLVAKLMQEDPKMWDNQELQSLPTDVRNALQEQRRVMQLQTPYEDLPTWQKINLRAMSNPAYQGALSMAPFALMGGAMGAAGGAATGSVLGLGIGAAPGAFLGGIIGAGVPLALGAGLGWASSKSPTAANLLMMLDYPAEWLEQASGVGLQAAGSMINPDFYGALEEVTNNLPEAWQAAHMTDTTGAYFSYGKEAPLNFLYPALGLDPETRGRFDITNVMPALNYVLADMMGNEEEKAKIRFAGPNEVFFPSIADPQQVEATGLAALVNLRREIIKGADPIEAINRYTQDFGLSGQFTELAAHVILDPLNVLPTGVAKGVGKVAGVLGDVEMAKAFGSSVGPVQGWKKYRNSIRTGLVGAADELSGFQRFVGGLDAEGAIKTLTKENSPRGPFARVASAFADLTSSAKGRLFVSHGADNIGVLLDMRRGDPNGQVALFREAANRPPHEAAAIAANLGSPEMYTVQPALKTALPTIETALELYNSVGTQRNLLNKLIRILGDPVEAEQILAHYNKLYGRMRNGDVIAARATERAINASVGSRILKELRGANDADTFFQHLNNKLDQIDPAMANELRSDPGWSAEGIKGMMDAFSGDNPIPWHPDEFAAHVWGITNDATAKWAEAAYGIKPDNTAYRFFDMLKRAQSIVLLGFNPNYLIGNELGNITGRAATGIWGYATPGVIDNFIRRFGVEPYRFQAGVGAAGLVSEQKIKRVEGTEAAGEPIGRVGDTGEEVIRKAMIEQRGLIAKVRNKLDSASRFGIVSQASRAMEVGESSQAWYSGLKKSWNWMWNRDNMVPKLPPDVVDFFVSRGVDPNTVYSTIEGGMNWDEIQGGLFGEPTRYNLDQILSDVAHESGIELPMARDTLDDIYHGMKPEIDNAKTPDEVRSVFSKIEEAVQDHFDEIIRENLKTRAQQVQQQVVSGGFAESLRLWEEMHFNTQEYWIRHFDEWEHTFALADDLRKQNVPEGTIDRLFRQRMSDAKRQWKRVRSFENTTTKAILEGLGVDDVNARRYVDLLDQVGKRWDEYYKLKDKEFTAHAKNKREKKYATPEESNAAWLAIEERLNAEYDRVAGETANQYKNIDELFITIATDQFGEGVGSTARWWRENISNQRQAGTDMIAEFRKTLIGQSGAARRGAWEAFLNETYRPYIYEFFSQLDDGAMEMYKSASGNPPPDGAPPANPAPLPPEPTRPLPGDPRGPAVPDAELLAASDRLDSYLNSLPEGRDIAEIADIAGRVDEAIQSGELRLEIEGDTPAPHEIARYKAMQDYARTQGYELGEPEIIRRAPEEPVGAPAPVAPPPEAPPAPPAIAPEPVRAELAPETTQRLTDYGLTPDEIEAVRSGAMTPERMEEVIARVTQPEGPGSNVPGRGIIGGAGQPAPARVPETPGGRARTPVAPGDEGVPEYLRAVVRPDLEYDITNPKVREILREDIGQQTDLRRIFSNYKRGNRAYLLANGTGTGKTYVGMGAIVESGAKNVLVVMPSRNIFGEWEGAAKLLDRAVDTGTVPPDAGIHLTTYAALGKNPRKFAAKNYDLIIMDESHRMKGEGQWGQGADFVINDNPNAKLLFQSATPFQSAGQMEYLKHLGLWDVNDIFGFDNFLQDHHYTYVKPSVGPGYWRFDGRVDDILDIYRQINEKGLGSTRNLVIDQNLDNAFVSVPLDSYHSNLYANAEDAFEQAGNTVSGPQKAMLRAQRTIALRRILEMAKVDQSIDVAKRMLNEGRQVAIFTGFKGDLKAPHFESYRMRYANEILEAFYSTMNAEEGRTVQRMVEALGGSDVVAVVTGGISDRMKKLEINNYQTGRKKVIVATAASGGTGLSLHDLQGNAPRAQINMYLPWSGQDFQQVAGRSYRYGSKSGVKQFWLFGDAAKERQIAEVVGGRLQEMGGLVNGIETDVNGTKLQAFDFGLLDDERVADDVLNQPQTRRPATIEGEVAPSVLPQSSKATNWLLKQFANSPIQLYGRAVDEAIRSGKGADSVPVPEQFKVGTGPKKAEKIRKTFEEFYGVSVPEAAPPAPRFAPEEVRATLEGARPAPAAAPAPVVAPAPAAIEAGAIVRVTLDDGKSYEAKVLRTYDTGDKVAIVNPLDPMASLLVDRKNVEVIGQFQPQQPMFRTEGAAMVAAPTRRTTALGPDPTETFNFDFEIRDLDSLVTSHSDLGEVNPAFPAELQPRGRDRVAAMQQVNKIAAQLNPDAYLADTHRIDSGSPIVNPDNLTLSGNGRTIALRVARDLYPENYARYVETLRNNLAQYGLTESDLAGINNPVLVRVTSGDIDMLDFTAKANQSATLRMSTYETALQDARLVNDDLLASLEVGETQSIDQALNSTPNRPLVRSFLDSIPENERAALVDAQGNLSRAGLERLKSAMFAKTYPGEAGQRLLAAFAESIDPGIKNFESAMYSSLPDMARAEGAIRSGQRGAELTLSTDISKVVDVYARLKATGQSVTDYIAQKTMFGAELDDFQKALLSYISENSRNPKRLREMLIGYARAVMDQPPAAQMSMFAGARSSKPEILQNVLTQLTPEALPFFPEQGAPTIPGGEAPELTPIVPGGEELAGAFPGGAAGGGEIVGRISQAVQPEAPKPAAPPRTSLDDVNALARQYGVATASETGAPVQTMKHIVNKYLKGEYGEPKNVNGVTYEKQRYNDILDVPIETIQDALDARLRHNQETSGSGNALGPYPPGTIENLGYPEYAGMTEAFAWEQRVRPLLEGLEEGLINQTPRGNIGGMDMPPGVRGSFNRYMDQTKGNLASSKLASIRWAENLRDQALINYSKQRGFDNMLNILFPYQYWYTRSMWQWAQRMIDRPKWFANYARLRNYQRNLVGIPGFPSRMRDKMAIPAPYLPDWAGGEAWIDPLRQAFYPEQFMSPIDKMARDEGEVEQRAAYIIQKWAQDGKLSRDQARQAIQNHSGPQWETAMADAQRAIAGEEPNSLDFLGLMLGPALYLTLPGYLATGKDIVTGRDDIPMLPITRTGRSLKAITQNTPLHALGQAVGGIMSWPEEALRRKRGISEFGDWGDYYVDRMLSNMATEGNYTPKEVVQAMIERTGNPIYDEANERVRLETALRSAGALPAYAALHGAAWNNPTEFAAASLLGWFPTGLVPEGEMEQRKLGEVYKMAREQYNAGDPDALNNFFDEYPEYEARLALYDEPEERLRQFLLSEVWDRYTGLSGVDKQVVRQDLGDMFGEFFLSKETRNYDALDNDTLAAWARYMGGEAPNAPDTNFEDMDVGMLMTAPPEEATAVDAFRQLRGQLFPNWYAAQSMYFEQSNQSGKKQVLRQFPWLPDYWDWSRAQKKANPVIGKYSVEPEEKTSVAYDLSFVKEFTPAMARGLLGYYYANEPLSQGALSELRFLWTQYGQPGGDFETFVNEVVPMAVAP